MNFTRATSTDIVEKTDNILENQPMSLIVYLGTDNLTNSSISLTT